MGAFCYALLLVATFYPRYFGEIIAGVVKAYREAMEEHE